MPPILMTKHRGKWAACNNRRLCMYKTLWAYLSTYEETLGGKGKLSFPEAVSIESLKDWRIKVLWSDKKNPCGHAITGNTHDIRLRGEQGEYCPAFVLSMLQNETSNRKRSRLAAYGITTQHPSHKRQKI